MSAPSFFGWFWHDGEWNLRLSYDSPSRATVYPNGVWHTWDHNGTGGENDSCYTIAEAKEVAFWSAKRQGFLDVLDKVQPEVPKVLDYERLYADSISKSILTHQGESVLVRNAFRWMLNGQVVSNAYESCSMEQVCEDRGWRIVVRYGEHIAVVATGEADLPMCVCQACSQGWQEGSIECTVCGAPHRVPNPALS